MINEGANRTFLQHLEIQKSKFTILNGEIKIKDEEHNDITTSNTCPNMTHLRNVSLCQILVSNLVLHFFLYKHGSKTCYSYLMLKKHLNIKILRKGTSSEIGNLTMIKFQ